jgi:hypothetical protein
MPLAVAGGAPARVAVPAVPVAKVTPEGSAPDSVNVGVGVPVAVTWNDCPALPAVNVVDAPLVNSSVPLTTVSVNDCLTVAVPLVALNVSGKLPSLAEVNDPPSVAVPLVPGVKVTPAGSVPDSVKVGVGVPVAITVNDGTWPTVNAVDVKEVNAGAEVTVSVNAWVVVPLPLVALMVKLYTPAATEEAPASVAVLVVPLVAGSVKVAPAGRLEPVARAMVGAGPPLAVTVKLKAVPAGTVSVAPLIKAGT